MFVSILLLLSPFPHLPCWIISVLPSLAPSCQFPLSRILIWYYGGLLICSNPTGYILYPRVSMFALLHLFHIAPPLCPHFLDFSSIDLSACRMGLIHKHRCLSFNRTQYTNQTFMSVILEISIFSKRKIQII